MAPLPTDSAQTRAPVLLHEGRTWSLVDGEHVIGRGEEAAVQLAAPGLSRRHARIVVVQGVATLEDLQSKNGTFCNDEPVTSPRTLRDGDVIQLGQRVRLAFRLQGADPTETEGPGSIGALRAVFRKDGELWTAAFEGHSVRLVELKGFGDLARLLAQPGIELHCLELADRVSDASAGDVILDERARREIRTRAADLQREIEDADAAHDLARSSRAREELDKLVDALTGAMGLGGRPRRLGSAAERARSAVTWRMRSAIRKIAAAHPRLGRHLDNAVRTGHFCVYEPEQPVVWYL
jgi:hypothetical protein